MKSYSDNVVSKTEISDLTSIDGKQNIQIIHLRWAIAISFIVNLGLTVGMFLTKFL